MLSRRKLNRLLYSRASQNLLYTNFHCEDPRRRHYNFSQIFLIMNSSKMHCLLRVMFQRAQLRKMLCFQLLYFFHAQIQKFNKPLIVFPFLSTFSPSVSHPSCISFFFLIVVKKTHETYPFKCLSVQYSVMNHKHSVVEHYLQNFFISCNWNVITFEQQSPLPLPLTPGNHQSVFCIL